MISISSTSEMPHDLWMFLKGRGHNPRNFTDYGIVSGTGEFNPSLLGYALLIANKIAEETVTTVHIGPGEWQPGAMQYLIYLMK